MDISGHESVEIKPMDISGYDEIYQLWQSIPFTRKALNPADDSREGIARYLKRNPSTCFVAVHKAGSGSTIAGTILSGHDGRRAVLYHLAVAEHMRYKGIGRALVDAAAAALAEEGICKAYIVVFKDNHGGNAFWEAQGFHSRDDLVFRNRQIL